MSDNHFFIYINEHDKRCSFFLKELCVVDNLNDNHREKLRKARDVIEIEYEDHKRNETLRAADILNKIILNETNDLNCRIEKIDRFSQILIFLMTFKNLVEG